MVRIVDEHQQQGVLASGCYYCKLLYPDLTQPCRQCGGARKFTVARMMSQELIEEQIRQEVAECLAAVGPAERGPRVRSLLGSLFVYGQYAVQVAAEAGMELVTLRHEYEASDAS